MYQKYLTLVLFTLISGNVINFSLQNFDFYYVFAAEEDNQSSEEENQAPKADDQKVSVDANNNVKITLEGKDDDKDDKIKFEITSDPSHGKLDNFDKSEGTLTYVPEKDYSGDDKFKFKVVDDKGAESNVATIEVSIQSINLNQGVDNQPSQGVDNQPSQGVDNQPSQGVDNQTAGEDTKNTAVNSINQSPKAYDQSVSLSANDKIDIALFGSDPDNDPLEFAIVSKPSDASLNNFDMTEGSALKQNLRC